MSAARARTPRGEAALLPGRVPVFGHPLILPPAEDSLGALDGAMPLMDDDASARAPGEAVKRVVRGGRRVSSTSTRRKRT